MNKRALPVLFFSLAAIIATCSGRAEPAAVLESCEAKRHGDVHFSGPFDNAGGHGHPFDFPGHFRSMVSATPELL